MYDGEKVVHEIFTGEITGMFDQIYKMQDRDTPLAIEEPDAGFKDGIKKDQYLVGKIIEIGELNAATRAAWEAFTLALAIIPGADASANNNVFALRLAANVKDPENSVVSIKMQVHGHSITFKSGGTEYAAVVRKFTQVYKILDVPLGGANTPVTLTEAAPAP